MKQILASALFLVVLAADAACTRERGIEIRRMFENCSDGNVVTNKDECVRTVNDAAGAEYKFWYSKESGALSIARIQRADGGVDRYEFCGGELRSASTSSTNLMSMVISVFIGDGKSTNAVDRMEFDSVNGKIVGPLRFLDANGKRVSCPLPTKPPSLDKEYIPSPGMTGKIGPYEWTVIDEKCTGALSHNGSKLLESDFSLGGRYPWIVGFGHEGAETANRKKLSEKGICPKSSYGSVYYYFTIDMRNDHVDYIPVGDVDNIERITGLHRTKFDLANFWGYFLSKRGPERLAKREAALKAPADAEK